jgi:hypothetical protein
VLINCCENRLSLKLDLPRHGQFFCDRNFQRSSLAIESFAASASSLAPANVALCNGHTASPCLAIASLTLRAVAIESDSPLILAHESLSTDLFSLQSIGTVEARSIAVRDLLADVTAQQIEVKAQVLSLTITQAWTINFMSQNVELQCLSSVDLALTPAVDPVRISALRLIGAVKLNVRFTRNPTPFEI